MVSACFVQPLKRRDLPTGLTHRHGNLCSVLLSRSEAYLLGYSCLLEFRKLRIQECNPRSNNSDLSIQQTQSGNPDFIKNIHILRGTKLLAQSLKMYVQVLISVNKVDEKKQFVSLGSCSNRDDPCPHWVTWRPSSFTSSTPSTDLSFHFYDKASVTLSPVVFGDT